MTFWKTAYLIIYWGTTLLLRYRNHRTTRQRL